MECKEVDKSVQEEAPACIALHLDWLC